MVRLLQFDLVLIYKEIKLFIANQLIQIYEQGIIAIWRKSIKIIRLFFIYFMASLFLPLILFIRLIKPFIWIRFGWFFASRIGHFAFDIEYYLCEKKILNNQKMIDLFFYKWGKPANYYFSKLVKKHIFVKWWVEPLFIANSILPGGNKYKILPAINNWSIDERRINNGKLVPPNFYYSSDVNKEWMSEDELRNWIKQNYEIK